MTEPTSMEELARLQLENAEVSGEGISGVTQHFPCPVCGAKDWYVVRVIDFATTSPPIDCSNCHRVFQLLYEKTGSASSIECVQVGGPEQPDWLQPKMRVLEP